MPLWRARALLRPWWEAGASPAGLLHAIDRHPEAVVLSGKGGTAKTLWQMTMAGEASRSGLSTLLIDVDPERNLSNRFGVPQHSTGLGSVFEQAGVTTGEGTPSAAPSASSTRSCPLHGPAWTCFRPAPP